MFGESLLDFRNRTLDGVDLNEFVYARTRGMGLEGNGPCTTIKTLISTVFVPGPAR